MINSWSAWVTSDVGSQLQLCLFHSNKLLERNFACVKLFFFYMFFSRSISYYHCGELWFHICNICRTFFFIIIWNNTSTHAIDIYTICLWTHAVTSKTHFTRVTRPLARHSGCCQIFISTTPTNKRLPFICFLCLQLYYYYYLRPQYIINIAQKTQPATP